MGTRTVEANGVTTKLNMEIVADGRDSLKRVNTTVNPLEATEGERFDSKCFEGEAAAATEAGVTTATGKDSKGVGDAFAAEAKC